MSDKVSFPDKEGVSSSLDTATGLVELSRWSKEAWVRFGSSSTLVGSEKSGDKYKLTYGEYAVQVYELPNGLEYEIIIGKIPSTNVFTIPITSQNLNFFYQGELTQAEIDAGCTRPENVVGSYAVYHPTKRNNEYRAGKAFHIYRPLVTDAQGATTWGVLNYDGVALTITVDIDWLAKAKYPVVIDPTIGYETAGGSTIYLAFRDPGSAREGRYGTAWLAPGGGTANKITAYIGGTRTCDVKAFINQEDSAGNNKHGELVMKTNLANPAGPGWVDFTLTATALAPGIYYVLNAVGKDNGTFSTYNIYYDTVIASGQGYRHIDTPGVYVAEQDPWQPYDEDQDYRYSIYCTYTAAPPAGGGLKMIPSLKGHMGYDLKTRGGKARRRIF